MRTVGERFEVALEAELVNSSDRYFFLVNAPSNAASDFEYMVTWHAAACEKLAGPVYRVSM